MHYCSTSGGNEISFATIVIHGIWDTNRSCHPDRWLHGYLYGNIHAKPKNICKVITEQEQLNFTLTNLQITKRVSTVKTENDSTGMEKIFCKINYRVRKSTRQKKM